MGNVDVISKKRYDLIPNLVSIVKGYMAYEKETFEKIVELRNQAINAANTDHKVRLNNEIDTEFNKIIITAENYPELKSSQNFIELQKTLLEVEDELSAARRTYNASVAEYNTTIQTIPSVIVAKCMGAKIKELFRITELERENQTISF
jgi:LemA protein